MGSSPWKAPFDCFGSEDERSTNIRVWQDDAANSSPPKRAATSYSRVALCSAFATAVGLALVSDTLSIAVMELVDNTIILLWPGAMDAGLADLLFWGSLAIALAVAFVAAFPVNRALIARGRGHAAVHAHHH